MKVLGYARTSTDEQELGLISQQSKVEQYAKLNDMTLTQIITDQASGKTMKREGLEAVLEAVKAREIDAVVIYRLDRLSRRLFDILSLMQVFEKYNVSLHSVSEHLDTSSPSGRFLINILGSLSQMERELISERTTSALAVKKQNGEKTGGFSPFGYEADEQGKLLPVEREQDVVKRILSLRGEGYSFYQIANQLNKDKVRPKRAFQWNKEQVRRTYHFHQTTTLAS